ncbi:conjugal transfer protein [Staphylococcus aureus]|uniref:conjugal transfer protein n=1 Tax=Staphylococcus aureus TaxID=1280 RepID=UPI00211155DE|nr:conjugal transfer protein [Staphylococcus aureus]MCQ6827889.1 conjugal transfer protein [Staphylococcus aureus]
MNLIKKISQNIKEYFLQFERRKKNKFKLSKKFQYRKILIIVIWIALGLFIVLSAVSIYKSNVVYKGYKNEKTIEERYMEAQQKEQVKLNNDPKTKRFTEKYIDSYINVPENDDERKKRQEELANLSSKDIEEENIKWKGSRELKSKTFYDSKMKNGILINQYIVEYTSQIKEKKKDKKGKEKEEKKEKTNQMIVNISIKGKNGNYKVVESPYFTAIPDLSTEDISSVKNNLKEDTTINNDKVKTFVEDFFKAYTEKSQKDMAYIMDKPESVYGLMVLDKVESVNLYKKDNSIIAKVKVSFVDEGMDNPHSENFTLKIVENGNTYKVKKLNHTIGKVD